MLCLHLLPYLSPLSISYAEMNKYIYIRYNIIYVYI